MWYLKHFFLCISVLISCSVFVYLFALSTSAKRFHVYSVAFKAFVE